jgi:SAM-dependent methyltransferase
LTSHRLPNIVITVIEHINSYVERIMSSSTNSPTLPTGTAAEWLQRWDDQQRRYVPDREERFAVIGDVVETAVHDVPKPVILDLGCGPGSLGARLKTRMPDAQVVGIDTDPLLLGLGRAHYRDAITWVDADLRTGDWAEQVPPAVHAAVSTTALHWLPATELAALYRTLGKLLAPGGVFVNGDHLRLDDTSIDAIATVVRDRRTERVGVAGNEEWQAWWNGVFADPRLAGLVAERARRLHPRETPSASTAEDSVRHGSNRLSAGEHAELLRAAGFSAAAPVWQVGDDRVLVAVR